MRQVPRDQEFYSDLFPVEEAHCRKASCCDRNSETCVLHLSTDNKTEYKPIGIDKLLSDYDQTKTLVPEGPNESGSEINGF